MPSGRQLRVGLSVIRRNREPAFTSSGRGLASPTVSWGPPPSPPSRASA